jgi:hypothetical protein
MVDVFPLALSNGPPTTAGLKRVAAAGATHVRTGIPDWSLELADGQLQNERAKLDAAQAAGLRCWVWLGATPNLPPRPGSDRERLLTRIVDGLKGHPAIGAWKGIDEPAWGKVPAAGLVRAYRKIKQLDPTHPLVLIQAPRATAAQLAPYRPACDVMGVDIYPVSYPPGIHAGGRNRDLSVVGDVTRTLVAAARAKPVWTTLQIAWSGVTKPGAVPRFPTLHDERFMAYQAIVAGARGLAFFGGHLPQVMRPADARVGWNWAFWTQVLEPLLRELSSTAVSPALVAPNAKIAVKASERDVAVSTRAAGGFVYVLAVRRGAATSQVRFSGLPAGVGGGQVLFEYVHHEFRGVAVRGGAFHDWLGPHDARVYRFKP